MFHFENTLYFVLLLALPILGLIYVLARVQTKRQQAQFAQWATLQRLAPKMAPYKRTLKLGLVLAAMVLLVVALANPRLGNTTQSVKREGVDLYLILDVSRSMWAEDISPNRMERARQLAQKLVYERRGDRIGLVIFAGYPYLQMPLTTDYAAARTFIQIASPKLDITQGTAVGDALQMVADLSKQEEQKTQRAAIIITDGENHEDQAPVSAERAKDAGVTTYVVGIGTETGAPIPIRDDRRAQFQLDNQGQIVQSKMNTALMQEIAERGGGQFYKANEQTDLVVARLSRNLDKLETTRFEQQEFDVYDTYFQIFVALAMLLLVVEFLISYRKTDWF